MKLDDVRIRVLPGDGVVGRFADALVVVPFDAGTDQAAVDRLLAECAKGDLGPRLTDLRAAAAGVSAYAVIAEADGGLAVHVEGDAQAAIAGAPPVLRLSGRAPGWSNVFHDPFSSLGVGRGLDAADSDGAGRLDLRAGVVTGQGAVLLPAGADRSATAPAVAAPMAAAPAPAAAMPAAGMRAAAMPGAGMPAAGMPGATMPAVGMPPDPMPAATMPAAGMPTAASAGTAPGADPMPEPPVAHDAMGQPMAAPVQSEMPPIRSTTPSPPAQVQSTTTVSAVQPAMPVGEPAPLEPVAPPPIATHAPTSEPVAPPVVAPPSPATPAPIGVQPTEVWGVRCKKGHFNDPEARYCAICGLHMLQDRAVRVKGPRPVLGYLVFDDGKTYKLDMDYVIGRNPGGHEAVQRGEARPLVFGADEDVISEVHARITLRDWDVLVSDCRSLYGTYVWAPGASAWERLGPETPVKLNAGSQVMLAQRGFMFQPVNKR